MPVDLPTELLRLRWLPNRPRRKLPFDRDRLEVIGGRSVPLLAERKSRRGTISLNTSSVPSGPTVVRKVAVGTLGKSLDDPEFHLNALRYRFRTKLRPEDDVAITPDGSRIVYPVTAGGRTRLVVRAMDELEALLVPGILNNIGGPFVSPDGNWVAYVNGGALTKVSIDGGPLVTLCTIPGGIFRGGSWGDEGTIVFATGTGGLWRVSSWRWNASRADETGPRRREPPVARSASGRRGRALHHHAGWIGGHRPGRSGVTFHR